MDLLYRVELGKEKYFHVCVCHTVCVCVPYCVCLCVCHTVWGKVVKQRRAE